MQYTPQPAASPTPPPTTLLITPGVNLTTHLATCPHAQTLSGYRGDPPLEHIMPLPCKQWSCRYCAQRKIRTLAAKTREAMPNRLCTLTVDPKLYADPRAAFDATRDKIPRLIDQLRKRFGDLQYLRITELTNSGWPHYHLLIRSGYLPHQVIKSAWHDLTGAIIVDIRQVPKTWSAVSYLTKYLTKLHRIEWTERHVSYSRNFFPHPPEPDQPSLDLSGIQIIHQTPANYIQESAQKHYLVRVATNLYRIQPDPPTAQDPDPCPPSSPKPTAAAPAAATPNATTPDPALRANASATAQTMPKASTEPS